MRLRGLVVLSGCSMLIAAFGQGRCQDPQTTASERVMQLVKAHESSLGLIHQFDIQLDVWDQPNFGKWAGTPAVHIGTSRWSRKDELERIREVDLVRTDGFGEVKKVLFGDQFEDGTERRVLRGWDPEHPVSLTPKSQNGIKCYLERQVDQPMSVRDPAPLLLLYFRDMTDNSESRLSLADLVRRAKAVEVREGAPDRGLLCLRLWRDVKLEAGQQSGHYFDVFLDPRAGMLARKLVNHHDHYPWPGEGMLPWAEWVHEVKTFHDAGEGVFVTAHPTSGHSCGLAAFL